MFVFMLRALDGSERGVVVLGTPRFMLQAPTQVLPGLLHAIRMGHAQASYFALRTLFLLSGVDNSLLEQLSTPEKLALLSLRAWHGKPEAQSVALLLLRDLGRQHPKQVANIATGTVPLLIGLQASPVPEVAQFAQETVQLLSTMPAVSEEVIVQVRFLFFR